MAGLQATHTEHGREQSPKTGVTYGTCGLTFCWTAGEVEAAQSLHCPFPGSGWGIDNHSTMETFLPQGVLLAVWVPWSVQRVPEVPEEALLPQSHGVYLGRLCVPASATHGKSEDKQTQG